MSSFFSTIWDGLKNLFKVIADALQLIKKAIVNFVHDVVNYFKSLTLDPKKDTPFVIEAGKLGEMIKEAPKVKIGIFEGVYNEDTNTIKNFREISADKMDDQTNDLMKNATDGIVALS